jgi:hypothetical protein
MILYKPESIDPLAIHIDCIDLRLLLNIDGDQIALDVPKGQDILVIVGGDAGDLVIMVPNDLGRIDVVADIAETLDETIPRPCKYFFAVREIDQNTYRVVMGMERFGF